MKSEPLGALLINDMDPAESKGAASIALDLASRVFGNDDFVYLCTTKKSKTKNPKEDVHYEYLTENSLDRARDKVRNRFPALEGIMRVFAIRRLWRIFLTTRRLSPKVVWVHQIGWRIPVTSLLLFSFLKVPVFLTIHDYSFLRFRKLYPNDFSADDRNVEASLKNFHINGSPLDLKFESKTNFWHRADRFIISRTCSVIYISELQASIYQSAGYPSGLVVNNTVKPCNCSDIRERMPAVSDDLDVLFAGRMIGKGLERVVESVSLSNQVHLHLAGGNDLVDYVQDKLPSHRYTYHGMLNEQNLYRLIHSVDITAVPSACFDVFPTITIESIAHKTPVISTPTTGNFNFSRNIDESLGLSLSGIIPFEVLGTVIQSRASRANLEKIQALVSSDATVKKYRSLFSNMG